MIVDMEFHHIGVACRGLEAESEAFSALGYAQEGSDFEDPVQGVRGRFLVGAGPRLELLAPLRREGVLTPWLQRGTKLYHLAYRTRNLAESLARLKLARARVMVAPIPSVAFGGSDIAFALMPNLLLLELIEVGVES
ncbi:MAG TPA: VOC family protein [Gemmatimonadales bacterium]|nr:VOC family protein [Gemmatimonadales bacterium]